MKIKVKTLDRRTFEIDISEFKTVGELKSIVCRLRGNWAQPDSQQLLYGGQVLDDFQCLRTYCIDERKYLLMLAKKPPLTPLKKSESEFCNKFTVEIEEESFNKYSKPTQTPPLTKKVIMELGPWTENDVRRALLISLNNPNRAMDYLMNGEEFFPNMVTPPDSSHIIRKTHRNKFTQNQKDVVPKPTENIHMTERIDIIKTIESTTGHISNSRRLENLQHLLEMGFPREKIFHSYVICLGDAEKTAYSLREQSKEK